MGEPIIFFSKFFFHVMHFSSYFFSGFFSIESRYNHICQSCFKHDSYSSNCRFSGNQLLRNTRENDIYPRKKSEEKNYPWKFKIWKNWILLLKTSRFAPYQWQHLGHFIPWKFQTSHFIPLYHCQFIQVTQWWSLHTSAFGRDL